MFRLFGTPNCKQNMASEASSQIEDMDPDWNKKAVNLVLQKINCSYFMLDLQKSLLVAIFKYYKAIFCLSHPTHL